MSTVLIIGSDGLIGSEAAHFFVERGSSLSDLPQRCVTAAYLKASTATNLIITGWMLAIAMR